MPYQPAGISRARSRRTPGQRRQALPAAGHPQASPAPPALGQPGQAAAAPGRPGQARRPPGQAPATARQPRATRPQSGLAPAAPSLAAVTALGPTVPDANATFAGLGVPAQLVAALADTAITTPFPIQAAVLPDALAGRDILGRGRTGSGKTLGFSIPLVARLADGYTSACRPRGLVLVPTRELANQVQAVLVPLAAAMDLTVATIFGGTGQNLQVAALRRRVDIIVACPGRLADLIGQGHCHLGDVEITVLDEADHMADLGFLPVVRRLLAATPPDGQRMLFSATLDNAVDVLVRQYLASPAVHSVDSTTAAPTAMVHHLLTVTPPDRVGVVAALAGGNNRSLVFTRTKSGAQRLTRQLTGAGVSAVPLHGDLGQGARERNLASFAAGAARVLVATDIAARGIHVDGIDLVIHADPPADHKAYLHRSGRTARAGAAGVVITVQTPAQAPDVRALMRRAGVASAAVSVNPGSALLHSIAGPRAERVAAVALTASETALTCSPALGQGAVAMSAGYRGRRRR
jgi:superfamily II DNA/RNA helicase